MPSDDPLSPDTIHRILATAEPDDWLLFDEQSGAALLPDLRLSLAWDFSRPDDDSRELGEPWTQGYPPVWRGNVTLYYDGAEIETVPGVCVRGSAFLPWVEDSAPRVVPNWKRGLFRLVSASSPKTEYGLVEFDVAWDECGFSIDPAERRA